MGDKSGCHLEDATWRLIIGWMGAIAGDGRNRTKEAPPNGRIWRGTRQKRRSSDAPTPDSHTL